MSNNDYADLRALAERCVAARGGPLGINVQAREDFKRATSPERILALLADLDAARRAVWASEEIDRRAGMLAGVQAERDALAAKVETVLALIEQHTRPSQTWAGMPLREGGVTLSELRRAVGGTA